MSKLLKKKRKIDLPYWPSSLLLTEAVKMLKDKGIRGTDEELSDRIHKAYWTKRAQILANHHMTKYEKA